MKMLAVRCCLRQRSKISVASFSLFSSQRTTLKTLIGKTDRRFTVLPCRLSVDHCARFVSLSASSRADAGASPEQENFGSLSEDISSRRSFRKSSPDLRDLRHERESMEEEEEPLRRPLRRNTPYWYFLQCKKLIKEKKVGELRYGYGFLHHLRFILRCFYWCCSCRRPWICSAETCCRRRGCSQRSSTTLCL